MSPGGWGLLVGIQCYGSGIVSSSPTSPFGQDVSHSDSAILSRSQPRSQTALPYGYEKRLEFDITLPARDHFLEWGRGPLRGKKKCIHVNTVTWGKGGARSVSLGKLFPGAG
jgi:hypothetical protein